MELSVAINLVCRECGAEHGHVFSHVCPECFGALEVSYEYSSLGITRGKIELRRPSMWRYRELLPLVGDEHIVDIGTGYTPLINAERLARRLGVRRLYVKNETVNPTFSFKDRPSSMAVSKALEFKLSTVGCASTGNLAAATSAHSARAGLGCFVFMPRSVEQPKIYQSSIYGASIVLLDGTYDDVNRLAALAADRFGIGIVNVNLRPYYVEGSKTVGLEITEQLGWRTPDRIIVPTASGALLSAIYKGIKESHQVGLTDDHAVAMTVAQPEGCSPIVEAYRRNSSEISPVRRPRTIVQSLAIGEPGDGVQALRVVRESGGTCGESSDAETLEAVRLLASEVGIFAEPGGAISVAVLKRLLESGEVGRDEEVVCCVTGSGFKAMDTLPSVGEVYRIEASFESLKKVILQAQQASASPRDA